MESALSRFDHIDLVFAHNDPGAHGAYLAAKAAGRDNILFVGIDALPQDSALNAAAAVAPVPLSPMANVPLVEALLVIVN
jgi:ribose transport system substrate-binding protein